MKRRILALILALALLAACPAGARAEMTSEQALAAFRAFSAGAAGTYVTQRAEDTAVLELIPAFNRLFASVGYYIEGSLYSYYAAELIPGDLTSLQGRAGNAETSFLLEVRPYSNMSNAGDYWPGDARQRLTLTGEGLELSAAEGDGEGLLGGQAASFTRRKDGALCYGPESVALVYNTSGQVSPPEGLRGAWHASWRVDGIDAIARVDFGEDGVMTLLRDRQDGRPPQLLRGGYALVPAEEDSYTLCYMLSAVESGAMPYPGSARLTLEGGALAVDAVEMEDCLLLPEGEAALDYERGVDPLTLGWMAVSDKRDGKKFFDVRVTDPLNGGEEILTVMKDGSTTFGWPSGKNALQLMALRLSIESGGTVPVLYHARWGVIDLLLVLGDIAEDTRLLMMRAPYFPLLCDYREFVADGSRQGSEASIAFNQAGEPALFLANRTDYPVQRDMTAVIHRRVGRTFTAMDEAGNSVAFEYQDFGCIEITEEQLSFATGGFPGFAGVYYRSESQ